MKTCNNTINKHLCSEPNCRHELDTYALNGHTIGTCRNPECRLFGVTLDTERLRKLTESERVQWGKTTATHRALFEDEQRERDARVSKMPAHLRRLG